MNTEYPMQNQKSEEICQAVKDIDYEIERDIVQEHGWLPTWKMKRYILSDICIENHDHSIPTIPDKKCPHSGLKR